MNKVMIVSFSLLIILATSCSVVAPMLGLNISGHTVDYSALNPAYVPDADEINNQIVYKYTVCPQAFDKEWVVARIDYWISYYSLGNTNYHNLSEMNKNIVFDKVYFDIDEMKGTAESKYPAAAYFTVKNTIDLVPIIKKGDIILTRNVYAMNILLNSRYSLHHAMLVTEDPTSDTSQSIITSFPLGFSDELGNVCMMTPKQLETEEFIVVLRFYNLEEEKIDQAVDYTLDQVGKPYNKDYIIKSKDNSFYCTQLVWKAFKDIGLDIDSTNNEWNDHGIVLPNDIFKSPYLRVIKYGN